MPLPSGRISRWDLGTRSVLYRPQQDHYGLRDVSQKKRDVLASGNVKRPVEAALIYP